MENIDTKISHCFSVEDATKFGVESAVILFSLRYWLRMNRAKGINIHENRVWTYNSNRALTEIFPYLSKDQIYRRLKKLEEEGIINTGNYNKVKYDQTKWYTVCEPEFYIPQNSDVDFEKGTNTNGETSKPIPDTIPVTNPDKLTGTSSLSAYASIDENENIDFQYWINLWNSENRSRVRLTPKKEDQIRCRLKLWSKDELTKAIVYRARYDSYINGMGSKYKNEWNSFWRNDEKAATYLQRIDETIEKLNNQNITPKSEGEARGF